MAYSEQTASSPDDVISKIATFAAANGWTIDRNNLVGSNRTLTLRNGTDYIHVYNTGTSNILMSGSVGYSSGATPPAQPNTSAECITNVGVGPYTKLYLFAAATPAPHIHAILETTSGLFSHMSFGMMDKLGSWTGGTYVDGTNWSTSSSFRYFWGPFSTAMFDSNGSSATGSGSIRCDIAADGRTNAWAQMDVDASYRAYTGLHGGVSNNTNGSGYLMTQVYNRNDPPFSSQVTLGTIVADVQRPSNFWSPLGAFPNVRYLTMLRFSPGQEITVGSDVWKIFPMRRKGVGTSGGNADFSNDHAYAYLKVP